MKAFPRILLRATAASVVLLVTLPLQARNQMAKYAGVYKGETHGEEETRAQERDGAFAAQHHTITVSLGPDGSATLTQSPDAISETTSFAHWTLANGRITLTFDPAPGAEPAAPMAFAVKGSELIPVTWDHTVWRRLAPPTLHRQ